MTPLLKVDDLVVRYRVGGALSRLVSGTPLTIEAVAGVSFELGAGETLGLVGESGSGKSTLARTIAGLAVPFSGSITFAGANLVGRRNHDWHPIRRKLAMMFQDPVGSLSPRLTVRALLAEPFKVHDLVTADLDQRLAGLLDMVGLPQSLMSRYPHQLSGGQARRVNVARALALEPRLLIADEPTAGLDVSVQGEILNLLNELQERLGISVLMITHNLHVVRHVAQRMAIMHLGRIVEQGTTAAVFAGPRHPYTAALLSSILVPDPDAVRSRIELNGEVPSLYKRPSGCEFHQRCPFTAERCRREAPSATRLERQHEFTCHFPMATTITLANQSPGAAQPEVD